MPTPIELSPTQLREALKLSEQIDSLRQRLLTLLGGAGSPDKGSVKTKTKRTSGRRMMSAEARAKISAAATARWARARKGARGKTAAAKPTAATPKKKGGLTAEGRARLAAAMKARWAARKKGAPAPNASSR